MSSWPVSAAGNNNESFYSVTVLNNDTGLYRAFSPRTMPPAFVPNPDDAIYHHPYC